MYALAAETTRTSTDIVLMQEYQRQIPRAPHISSSCIPNKTVVITAMILLAFYIWLRQSRPHRRHLCTRLTGKHRRICCPRQIYAVAGTKSEICEAHKPGKRSASPELVRVPEGWKSRGRDVRGTNISRR
ncbi:hypothetical protein BDR07DRAFT_1421111 [Suillus spraguei]|nr:hypothetical protein BDR07DRAFT_1421111 [Suillus spraguei]